MERQRVSSSWVFKDKEYVVACSVSNDVLEVMVEETISTDQWKGRFEAKRIEVLTSSVFSIYTKGIFVQILRSSLARLATSNSSQCLPPCWSLPLTRYNGVCVCVCVCVCMVQALYVTPVCDPCPCVSTLHAVK